MYHMKFPPSTDLWVCEHGYSYPDLCPQCKEKRKMTYRIFTNDRTPIKGVKMYSALKEVEASSSKEALKHCPPQFNAPYYAPAVAIRWPESMQSDDEKDWLRKHVDGE